MSFSYFQNNKNYYKPFTLNPLMYLVIVEKNELVELFSNSERSHILNINIPVDFNFTLQTSILFLKSILLFS